MRVTLLGTGCPVAHPKRGGSATLVEAEGARVLFDCGSMVTQRLVEAGCPGMELDALVVTHLHSDHLVDFYQLVVSSWHQGRERPWVAHCPETVVPVIEATMAAWKDERDLRIAFEQRPSATGFEVTTELLDPAWPLQIGTLTITPVQVLHDPVTPAYGFVLEAEGKKAVISGDTAVCEALIQAGQGADLLVNEVYMHHHMAAKPGVRGETTIRNTAAYHTLSTEVGGVATRMGAKALALTHFVPPDFDRVALLEEVALSYAGPIFVGEDLMAFDLTTAQVAWSDFRAKLP